MHLRTGQTRFDILEGSLKGLGTFQVKLFVFCTDNTASNAAVYTEKYQSKHSKYVLSHCLAIIWGSRLNHCQSEKKQLHVSIAAFLPLRRQTSLKALIVKVKCYIFAWV